MNKRTRIFGILSLASFLFCSVLQAAPGLIGYQGQLNDSSGLPVNDTLSFEFSLYDVPTGGTPLWGETQSVQVSSGIFNVQLGSVTPIPSSVFSGHDLYLGVQVGTDDEMMPRQVVTSAAFSQKTWRPKFSLNDRNDLASGESLSVYIPILDSGQEPDVFLYLSGSLGEGGFVPGGVQVWLDGTEISNEIGDPNLKGSTMFGYSGSLPIVPVSHSKTAVPTDDWAEVGTNVSLDSVLVGSAIVAIYFGNSTYCEYRVRFTYADGTTSVPQNYWYDPPSYPTTHYLTYPNPYPNKKVTSMVAEAVTPNEPKTASVSGYKAFGWGTDGVTEWDTGKLDLSDLIPWTEGDHFIEFRENGNGGVLDYLIMVD